MITDINKEIKRRRSNLVSVITFITYAQSRKIGSQIIESLWKQETSAERGNLSFRNKRFFFYLCGCILKHYIEQICVLLLFIQPI